MHGSLCVIFILYPLWRCPRIVHWLPLCKEAIICHFLKWDWKTIRDGLKKEILNLLHCYICDVANVVNYVANSLSQILQSKFSLGYFLILYTFLAHWIFNIRTFKLFGCLWFLEFSLIFICFFRIKTLLLNNKHYLDFGGMNILFL